MPSPPLRIVLIGTEYEINLGSAARLMRNFGQSPLYLVKPACEPQGFTSRMHAKHAVDVLEKAVVCDTLAQATEGCRMVVGTTGVLRRHAHALRHPLMLEEFRERVVAQKASAKDGPLAILFGPEGNGLCEEHIRACDLLITVPTAKRYPVMNLSHALAVVLYALAGQGKRLSSVRLAPLPGESAQVRRVLDSFVDRHAAGMNNPAKVKLAIKRVLSRAAPDQVEVHALLSALMPIWRELGRMDSAKTAKKKD